MNGVLATLEREGLIERRPHPTHGRILQVTLTAEGQRRLDAATPAVRELEKTIERDLDPEQLAAVKAWLVASAKRLEGIPPPASGNLRRARPSRHEHVLAGTSKTSPSRR